MQKINNKLEIIREKEKNKRNTKLNDTKKNVN